MSRLHRIKNFVFRHKWKLLTGTLVGLPIAAVVLFALSPNQPEYITQAAERGDLTQAVEAVGTVISERELNLQFPSAGVVSNVYVKEGDTVKQGQRLAQLRAGNLAADISSALARLQSAQADLRAKQEGARPEDIAVVEAEVRSKEASLEAAKTALASSKEALAQSEQKLELLKREAVTSLAGTISNVGSSITKELTTASNALGDVRNVFNNNEVIDAVIKNNVSEYDQIMAAINQADRNIQSLYASTHTPVDFQQAISMLDGARIQVSQVSTLADQSFNLISRLPATQYFTESVRETHKSTLGSARTSAQTALTNIDTNLKTVRDASASFATRISTEESTVLSAKGSMDRANADIANYEASLAISKAQLDLKRAPTRKTDLDVAAAAVAQARASLLRAQADFGNTIVTAPIAGIVTKVNVKAGEFTPSGAAITMLGESPYRIEMFVSEIDVPKVLVTQSGSIELDAFRDTHMKLRVSEIDSAPTDRDGVSKYRVRLDFIHPHPELRIGMTGDARIVTGTKENVVTVPSRAVLQNEDGGSFVRIFLDGDVEERTVSTGLEGEDGSVEVEGVEEGELVVVLVKE